MPIFTYDEFGNYSRDDDVPPKVTGEVLTSVSLNDDNRAELMRLAKNHFAMEDVVGSNADVIELKVIPNRAVRGLFNSKGGTGTVEVIPVGRERTEGLSVYRNEVLEAKQMEVAAARSARQDRFREVDDGRYRNRRNTRAFAQRHGL